PKTPAFAQRRRKHQPRSGPPGPPTADLLRVVQHLARISDRELGDALRLRACLRELLDDPARAGDLLERLLPEEQDGYGSD
ncbi:MAG: hypothetical protein JKY65_19370, partial [Planctomycetes bacterium]|nr:hypothetical protein [Planctomycetota bacterium]